MSVADLARGFSLPIPKDVCRDFDRASRLEWLDTNHTGAFAMGTVAGVNTRRYHALLVASLRPPADRFATLSRVEETVTLGGRLFELATAQYPGAVHPQGFRLLAEFQINPFPKWRYNLDGALLDKTVCLLDRQRSVLVRYEADQPCSLSVRMLLAFRGYHALAHKNPDLEDRAQVEQGRVLLTPYADLPPLTVLHSGTGFRAEPAWFSDNEYLRELERGLDFREDLYSPGSLWFDLEPGRAAWFIATFDPAEAELESILTALSAEEKRRQFASPLSRALDQFRIVRSDNRPSLLAGYPWFTDWGRDILISLPALSIAGFPNSESKAILGMLLEQRFQGLLPNRFTDLNWTPEYNTVDATLWLFAAAYEFVRRSGDLAFLHDVLYPAALDILEWHHRGTLYNIAVDPSDHLLSAGAPGVQLTWMDAKIGDYVVTPRSGKPVEINALWYNALRITAAWADALGRPAECKAFTAEADATRASFEQRFWNQQGGCLYDVLAPGFADASIRPNQLFALSLPWALVDKTRARSIVKVVQDSLLTRVGIRTLAPTDANYRPRFEGDMQARDSAYHQGTVWPWLIGPFISAYLYAFGETAPSIEYCRSILEGVKQELGACCLGSIAEVYDGDEPQRPGGCPAQLWSAAQVLIATSRLEQLV